MNYCPIPACGKRIAADQFMCGKHRRMISIDAAARIRHCRNQERRMDLEDIERMEVRKALRIALALAFAEVCVKAGIDPEAIGKERHELTALASAIRGVAH